MTGLSARIDAALDPNGVACEAFGPIRWSGRDTDATIAQVREHNAAWAALCRAAD